MNQKKTVEAIASRPRLCAFIKAMNYIPTALIYIAFPVLLFLSSVSGIVLTLEICAICAVPFFAVSFLRAKINAPRPGEIYGFTPIVSCRSGHSFPSRHALSAALIATVSYCVSHIMCIILSCAALVLCVFRYLAGVHRVRDLIFGILFGILFGAIGLVIINPLPI